MQIEFINYTKDFTGEQSVFYFEDVTEAIEWHDNYLEQYPDDETGCTYFSAYGVELPASVTMIKEFEELETKHSELEMEAAAQLINYGYANDFESAFEVLDDRGYFISGHGKLGAFENYLDEICYLDGVPEHLRWYIDTDAIMRDFEFDGLTIIELNDGDDFLFLHD